MPQISYAMQKLQKNIPEEFFYENGQKFRKLYKEEDFRNLKKKVEKIVESVEKKERDLRWRTERDREWISRFFKKEKINEVIPMSSLSRLSVCFDVKKFFL
jgi:thermostable 8-oxoguanine DNA glycosylase